MIQGDQENQRRDQENQRRKLKMKTAQNMTQITINLLTREVPSTLMAEVTAIVNARLLIPVLSDPDLPEILTPATLLT